MSDLESRLRFALAPVEPPLRLTDRFERTLTQITDLAVEELSDMELRSMKDPRNWARPAAALVVGSVAGGTLIVVQARQRQRRRRGGPVRAVERRLRDVAGEVRRTAGEVRRTLRR